MVAKKKKDEAIKTWTIDDKEYSLADLSESAKSQIVNLQVVDQEIAQLKQQLAIMQTARNAYGSALNTEIADKKPKAKTKAKSTKTKN
jgi:hypothetical protein